MSEWCEFENHVTSCLGVWGTLQREIVFGFLIMIRILSQKLFFNFIKIPIKVLYRSFSINWDNCFFNINKANHKGGEDCEFLLNSGKEVNSF